MKTKKLSCEIVAALAVAMSLNTAGAAYAATEISTDTSLNAGTHDGIKIRDGVHLIGTELNIQQSSDAKGIQVISGIADISSSSILQTGSGKYVTGVEVQDGEANVYDTAIDIDGAKDAGGLYVFGDNARISADRVVVNLVAGGSTTAEPAAAIKARKGTVVSSNSQYSVQGNTAFGLLASGNGVNAYVSSENDVIETTGVRGYGAFAFADKNGIGTGLIEISNGTISTSGDNAYALAAQGDYDAEEYQATASINADGLSLVTTGAGATGAYTYGADLDLKSVSIDVSGDQAAGVVVSFRGKAVIDDFSIVTRGIRGYGVHASADGGKPTEIILSNGSITTANEKGRATQNGDGPRAYAIYADGQGASVTGENVNVSTLGQRAYGAYAIDGGSVNLSDTSVATEGFMAYGIYASGEESSIRADGIDITTSGQVGDAVWAYDGGTVMLDGGNIHVTGEPNPAASGEAANGLVALAGANSTLLGLIQARDFVVVTEGARSSGILVGDEIGPGGPKVGGVVTITDTAVTVKGEEAAAARVNYGGVMTAVDSTFRSEQGAGIELKDGATVTLVGVEVDATDEAIRSTLTQSGQIQKISIGERSELTENNGTLLRVTRTAEGADGQVSLDLQAGSVTRGDIVDLDPKTTGMMRVYLREGASWSGVMRGVDDFVGSVGGEGVFEDGSEIGGNLQADSNDYLFNGSAKIQGDVVGERSSFRFGRNGTTVIGGDVVANSSMVSFGDGSKNTIGGSVRGTGTTVVAGENASVSIGDALRGSSSNFDFRLGGKTEVGGDVEGENTAFSFSKTSQTVIGGNVQLAGTSSISGGSADTPIEVAGNVQVGDSSRLGGNMVIGGDLTMTGGFLTPGNSIGHILVAGNHTFSANSVYKVEVDRLGNADRVSAEGVARLAGQVQIKTLSGSRDDFLPGVEHTIVSAEGGIDQNQSRFDGVSWDLNYLFLEPQLAYTETEVSLKIGRSDVSFASVASTRNQRSVASALDQMSFGDVVYDAVTMMSAPEARAAFDDLSGEVHAATSSAVLTESWYLHDMAVKRARGGREPLAGAGVWLQAYGSWGALAGDGNVAKLDRDTTGFFIGSDGAVNDLWRLGVAGGYGHSSWDLDRRASSADVASYHFALYGSARISGELDFRMGAGYTWHHFDIDRYVGALDNPGRLNSRFNGHTTQVFGELGYSIQLGSVGLEPYGSLSYVSFNREGFREKGGDAGLTSAALTEEVGFSTLGVRAAGETIISEKTAVTVQASLGWRHLLGDESIPAKLRFRGGERYFEVEGAPLARDVALVDLGLRFTHEERIIFDVSYSGRLGDGNEDHGVTGNLLVKF